MYNQFIIMYKIILTWQLTLTLPT